MDLNIPFDLIVTIVNKGGSETIIKATKSAGAEGGTIIPGRGTGIREQKKLWGIPIEPEKDIVLTIVPQEKTQIVLDAILEQGSLNKPGAGIAFVVDLKKVVGICHMCQLDT
ncbi:P-II family nitrogen regulator [Desulfonatronum sp. SC1]|uniref:P-II family nitrogen regulator n=1 Tax=Desulfonatronum sp. SC1 TaxID=2109626 RepID=UPI0018EE5E52|nr:P-II family nitrogen regulator [Desulfonatronum sp. SC1]